MSTREYKAPSPLNPQYACLVYLLLLKSRYLHIEKKNCLLATIPVSSQSNKPNKNIQRSREYEPGQGILTYRLILIGEEISIVL